MKVTQKSKLEEIIHRERPRHELVRTTITISRDVLTEVHARRGDLPVSRVIEAALRHLLGKGAA